MKRRQFLSIWATIAALPALASQRSANALTSSEGVDEIRGRWRDFVPPGADVATTPEPIERSASEWRRLLPEDAYRVLFEEDTEPPFTSPLNDEKRAGVFACRACGLALFTSEMKYDSGTGWPSFFTAIPGHTGTKTDFKLIWPRTEYHCKKCGGHQGHLFDDGPAPTGERWCNNGLALRFAPST